MQQCDSLPTPDVTSLIHDLHPPSTSTTCVGGECSTHNHFVLQYFCTPYTRFLLLNTHVSKRESILVQHMQGARKSFKWTCSWGKFNFVEVARTNYELAQTITSSFFCECNWRCASDKFIFSEVARTILGCPRQQEVRILAPWYVSSKYWYFEDF